MKDHQRIRVKAPSQSAVPPIQVKSLQSRPFSPTPDPATQQQSAPSIQAQLDGAKRFGYDLSNISVFPSASAAVQPKLTIGQPGDKYEQEADQVATDVVNRMNAPAFPSGQGESVQRMDSAELGTQPKDTQSHVGVVQRLSVKDQATAVDTKEKQTRRAKQFKHPTKATVDKFFEQQSQDRKTTPNPLDLDEQTKGMLEKHLTEKFEYKSPSNISDESQVSNAQSSQSGVEAQEELESQSRSDISANSQVTETESSAPSVSEDEIDPKLLALFSDPDENLAPSTKSAEAGFPASNEKVSKNNFKYIYRLGSDFENEEGQARDDKTFIGRLYELIRKLQAISQELYDAFQQKAETDKLKEIKDKWLKVYRHLKRQDIDVSPDGFSVSGIDITKVEDLDRALTGRVVEYDRGATSEETADIQKKTRVNINGKLFRSEAAEQDPGQPVDTTRSVTNIKGPGYEIYVMSPTGDFQMASHKVGKYHHSSLLAGADVAGAGEIKVESGNVKYLSNKSGHYQPGEATLKQVLHLFQKRNVNLDFTVDVIDGRDKTVHDSAANYLNNIPEKDTYSYEATLRVVEYFSNKKGDNEVIKALQELGWTQDKPNDFLHWKKTDGSPVDFKEIRQQLKKSFPGEQVEPEIYQI